MIATLCGVHTCLAASLFLIPVRETSTAQTSFLRWRSWAGQVGRLGLGWRCSREPGPLGAHGLTKLATPRGRLERAWRQTHGSRRLSRLPRLSAGCRFRLRIADRHDRGDEASRARRRAGLSDFSGRNFYAGRHPVRHFLRNAGEDFTGQPGATAPAR
jgi:hypothetical protein